MDGNAPSKNDYPRLRYKATRLWSGNPRKTVTGLDELAASIATNDIIEPLIVRELASPEEVGHEGENGWVVDAVITHEVLAGQRRWLAGQQAGREDFPYVLRQLDDATALEIALVENNQRVDPSPLEDAEAIQRRMTDPKNPCTAEYLADRLGRRVEWVKGRLALLSLCDEAKAFMRNGKLPLTHAQQLAAVDAATQRRVLDRFKTAPELPASKAFAHEITYALHLLSAAPFDANDAKLPGGACSKCSKRSDTQADLFDTGRGETGAHCLDNTCWSGKVTALWERAQRDAKKRNLAVLSDADLVHDGYGEGPAYVTWGKPYDVKPAAKGDAPVAIARTPTGAVVELYARPEKPQRGDGDDAYFEDEDGGDPEFESDEERAAWEKRRAEQEAKRAAEEAARNAETARLLALIPLHRDLFARLALDELTMQLYGPYDLRRILKTLGIDAPEERERTSESLVKLVPGDVLLDVVIAYVVSSRLNDEDMGDDPTEYERKARELVAGAPATAEAAALTRVWIREEEWDALSENGREAYTIPDVGQEIQWDGREGAVTAVVPAEWLDYLRTMAREDGLTLHEGEEPPPASPAKPSKKAARKKATARPSTEPTVAPEEPAAEEPVKPKPGELVFFKGQSVGNAITRITPTDLVVDVDGMEHAVPRGTITWRGRWESPEEKTETTTLIVSQADWQKHKSGLQDTPTGLLHKRWRAEGDDRVAVFPCGAGIYDRVLTYARKHGIEMYVDARAEANRVSPVDPPAAPKKARKTKGAK